MKSTGHGLANDHGITGVQTNEESEHKRRLPGSAPYANVET